MGDPVATVAIETEEIGLLLVHGMGEQKEQEHLLGTAKELASFIAATPGVVQLSVVVDDRDKSGSVIVDAWREQGGAATRTRLHLKEVWWADLGIRGGLWEQAKFWLWGLGQWAARTIRKGDRARNTEKLMAMPRFGYQRDSNDPPGALRELPSRLLLIGAALLAILTFFTWSAAKQVVSLLSRKLPEPSLIFMFLGDVKIYERPGGPGKGTILDPNHPVRTTIRRRMVSAMTAMAARTDLDRWYVFAHSLGTIPAFNALQETELALPNYLTEAEWNALPPQLKTRAPFEPPGPAPSTDRMMPRRPAWLDKQDGISRPRLFERFAGIVTYGSPLDKFAALWPRVVPLNRQAAVFPESSEWVNLYDPTDPVAASLDAFAPPTNSGGAEPGRIALVPQNFASRASPLFGLSHIRYFRPRAPTPNSMPAALAGALLGGPDARMSTAASWAAMSAAEAWLRMILGLLQVILLLAVLTTAAAGLLLAIGKALPDRWAAYVKQSIDSVSPKLLAVLQAGGQDAWIASGFIVLISALTAILIAGLARFATEGSGRHG
jgi:hypothetical protein